MSFHNDGSLTLRAPVGFGVEKLLRLFGEMWKVIWGRIVDESIQIGRETNTNPPDISIVYRALNEAKWFAQSLQAMRAQDIGDLTMEIVLVDSGSTDATLDIAKEYGCRITHISKSDFSFGRSLNQGCDFARGEILAFISAHCIPADEHWLRHLIQPLQDGKASYTYGRQIGHEVSKFSEKQLFKKYFPKKSAVPHEGFFCNNANSAILRSVWKQYKFDEHVTGLEDMVLGKQITAQGHKIGYVAEAPVIHIHEESFKQTQNRYYREALTLRDILPDVHMGFGDFLRYLAASIKYDLKDARGSGQFIRQFFPILRFRYAQFWGAYKGHNEVKKLSRAQKERYYYPAPKRGTSAPEDPAPPAITDRACAE